MFPSCQPAARVIVTTVGMISTIFGISLVVNSTRAGIDRRPMIGPSTSPRKRSMIVQAEPNTTCMNSIGHSLSTAIATISTMNAIATSTSPRFGTISKSGRSIGGGASAWAAGAVPGITMSATVRSYARLALLRQLHEEVERLRVPQRVAAGRPVHRLAHQDSLHGHLEYLARQRARHLVD